MRTVFAWQFLSLIEKEGRRATLVIARQKKQFRELGLLEGKTTERERKKLSDRYFREGSRRKVDTKGKKAQGEEVVPRTGDGLSQRCLRDDANPNSHLFSISLSRKKLKSAFFSRRDSIYKLNRVGAGRDETNARRFSPGCSVLRALRRLLVTCSISSSVPFFVPSLRCVPLLEFLPRNI